MLPSSRGDDDDDELNVFGVRFAPISLPLERRLQVRSSVVDALTLFTLGIVHVLHQTAATAFYIWTFCLCGLTTMALLYYVIFYTR